MDQNGTDWRAKARLLAEAGDLLLKRYTEARDAPGGTKHSRQAQQRYDELHVEFQKMCTDVLQQSANAAIVETVDPDEELKEDKVSSEQGGEDAGRPDALALNPPMPPVVSQGEILETTAASNLDILSADSLFADAQIVPRKASPSKPLPQHWEK